MQPTSGSIRKWIQKTFFVIVADRYTDDGFTGHTYYWLSCDVKNSLSKALQKEFVNGKTFNKL